MFDEDDQTLFSKARGNEPDDGPAGFATNTVTARYGPTIYTYDQHGTTICAEAA